MEKKLIYRLSPGHQLEFYTSPNLFSPNHIDHGTLAMLQHTTIDGSEKALDLGCGYGFVGIFLAKKYGLKQITMCDIDPQAVKMSQKNLHHNRIPTARVVLSDGLDNIAEDQFSIILSNPPYHTDFSVAKKFIEQSFKSLAVKGRLVLVVKRLLWYKNKMTSVFSGVKIKEDGGYYILTAEKRSLNWPEKQQKKVKPKHKRKMARSKASKRKDKSRFI